MSVGNFPSFSGTIVNTIEWGRTYRHARDQLQRPSILPKCTSLNMRLLWEQYQRSKQLTEIKELRRKLAIKPHIQKVLKERIDPNAVSKKEYYNYMSTPRQINKPRSSPPRPSPPPPSIPKWLLKKPKEQCSPHLDKIALPTKVKVLNTWKDYGQSLPMDVLTRLKALLDGTGQDFVPRFASCYFKALDKRKRKKHRNTPMKKNKKKTKKGDDWLESEICITVNLLVDYLEKESSFAVNFKQMMLSEAILKKLHEQGDLENKPSRNTRRPFGRYMVDIADQMSVWIDTIVRYVDAQYTESDSQLKDLSHGSLSSILEETDDEEEEEKKDKYDILREYLEQ